MRMSIVAIACLMLVSAFATDAGARSYRKNRRHKGLKQKKSYAIQKVVRKKKKVKKTEKRRPMQLEAFERFAKERILNRLLGQIKTLQEIIAQTPKRLRADLYFRNAEHNWEVAKYYDFVGHKYDDFRGRPEWPEKKRLQAQAWTTAKDYRRRAAAEYFKIIRGYPNFKQLCDAYYFLGKNLFDMGREKPALKVFRTLIKKFARDYPKCPYIPNAYLAFGEHYFNAGQVRTALTSYQQVLHFRNSSIYAFALYKVAWCYYNLVRYRTSLKKFIEVVQQARSGSGRWGSTGRRLQLLKEALRDLVLAYSQVGDANSARTNFFQWGGEGNYLKMMMSLGGLYREQGKNAKIISLYTELMNLQAGSPRTMLYQLYIAQAVDRTSSKSETIRAVDKLVRLVKQFRAKDPKNAIYLEAIKEIEPQVKEFATFRHYEGQRTRRPGYLREAMSFYKSYLALFDKTKDAEKMRFFYAELLYKQKKYEEAAVQYTKVLVANPKGKYALDSGYNPVLAYNKLMVKRGLDITNVGSKRGKSTKKKALPPIAKRFLKACETFLKYFPKGNRAIDVSYKAAQIYYFFNHYDKSLPRFYFLVKKFPKHEYAIYSAHYILDVYNIQERWVELNKWAWRFYKMPDLGNPKFKKEVRDLIVQSGMKTCQGIERKKKHAEAAGCFCKFANEFPENKRLAALALYNCSINRYKAGKVENALNIRRQFLSKYSTYKNPRIKTFVKKSILDLAGVYAERADFAQSASYYEMYSKRYKRDKKRSGKLQQRYYTSILRAGRFREANGEMEKAIDHFKSLIKDKKYRNKYRKEYVALYFRVAEYYKDRGNHSNYARRMRKIYDYKDRSGRKIRRFFAKGYKIHARMEHAMMEMKRGRRKSAEKIYRPVPSQFDRLSETDKKKFPQARYAAAQVRFMEAEKLFKEYTKFKLTSSMNRKQAQKLLAKKVKAFQKAKKAYQRVVKYKQGHWGVAAFFRVGDMALDYSKFLYNAPVPKASILRKLIVKNIRSTLSRKGLPRRMHYKVLSMPRVKMQIKNAVEQLQQKARDKNQQDASEPENTAVAFYQRSLRFAHRLSVYNVWTQRTLSQLAKLRPYDYPKPLEAMPRVGFSGSDFSFSKGIMGEIRRSAPAMPKPAVKKNPNVAIK